MSLDDAIDAAEEFVPSGFRIIGLDKDGTIWTATIAHTLSGERFEGSAFSADNALVAALKKYEASR